MLFVEFIQRESGNKIALNKNKIINVFDCGDYCGVDTEIDNHGCSIYVKGSFEEVIKKLNETS